MRQLPSLAGALAIAAAPLAAAAQPPGAYGRGDVCQQQPAGGVRHSFLGVVLGGLFAGLFGSAPAGRGHRAAGAVAGGGSVQCLPYPPRIETHEHNCRWVRDADGGADHQFEVCREPDGVWRPSGRS